MKFEIKSRWDGSVIFAAEIDTFKACVELAVKQKVSLSGADMSGAYMSGAYMSGADMSGAYMSGATGINPYLCTPLLLLTDQPDKIRAYKLVNNCGYGPFNGGIGYEIGQTYEVADANTDPLTQCAAGINVATLDWCIRKWKSGYKILIVEFTTADIAAIPTATDGKFRLRRCKVVGEKNLTEIGLQP